MARSLSALLPLMLLACGEPGSSPIDAAVSRTVLGPSACRVETSAGVLPDPPDLVRPGPNGVLAWGGLRAETGVQLGAPGRAPVRLPFSPSWARPGANARQASWVFDGRWDGDTLLLFDLLGGLAYRYSSAGTVLAVDTLPGPPLWIPVGREDAIGLSLRQFADPARRTFAVVRSRRGATGSDTIATFERPERVLYPVPVAPGNAILEADPLDPELLLATAGGRQWCAANEGPDATGLRCVDADGRAWLEAVIDPPAYRLTDSLAVALSGTLHRWPGGATDSGVPLPQRPDSIRRVLALRVWPDRSAWIGLSTHLQRPAWRRFRAGVSGSDSVAFDAGQRLAWARGDSVWLVEPVAQTGWQIVQCVLVPRS